jgi:capsid protein
MPIMAKFDAAQDGIEHEKHWQWADQMSAAAAASHSVRRKLRSRSRYEIQENSSLGKGLILKKAKDVVGTGPMMSFDAKLLNFDGETAQNINKAVNRAFSTWAAACCFAKKLRTAYYSYCVDGEVFVSAFTNRRQRHPVSLDLRLYEADLCTDMGHGIVDPNNYDGVWLDDDGIPVRYDLLRQHPGHDRLMGLPLEIISIDADQMIHLFREDRPQQVRGIPHTTPSLPLFAFRRRFILATVSAAEVAASHAGILQTDANAVDEDGNTFDTDVDPSEIFDFDRGSLTAMPHGWKLAQLRAEHPQSTIEMFDKVLVGEISRCLQMPFFNDTATTEIYTFASGKLDRDDWLEAIETEQIDLEQIFLSKVARWWFQEASLIAGLLPAELTDMLRGSPLMIDMLPIKWHWPRKRETDPAKQAQADVAYTEAHLLPMELFWQRENLDPDEMWEMLERQSERMEEIAPAPLQQESGFNDDEPEDE